MKTTPSIKAMAIMVIMVIVAINLIAFILYQADQNKSIKNQELILYQLSVLLGEQVGEVSYHQQYMMQFVGNSTQFYDEVREVLNITK